MVACTYLDHDVMLEVILKPFQLQLKDRGEIIKQHTFPRILCWQRQGQTCKYGTYDLCCRLYKVQYTNICACAPSVSSPWRYQPWCSSTSLPRKFCFKVACYEFIMTDCSLLHAPTRKADRQNCAANSMRLLLGRIGLLLGKSDLTFSTLLPQQPQAKH